MAPLPPGRSVPPSRQALKAPKALRGRSDATATSVLFVKEGGGEKLRCDPCYLGIDFDARIKLPPTLIFISEWIPLCFGRLRSRSGRRSDSGEAGG